jgi:predicted ester cyclase
MLSKKIKLSMAIILTSMTCLLALPASALANDKTTVEAFYEFLSNPSSKAHVIKFKAATAANWQSIGDYSDKNKTSEQLIGQMGGFAKLIPDLNWQVIEMIQQGNRVVVRGRATGTPLGPLFGVDGKGKSFDIMSIDIHTLEAGKITRTYHVEDWAGALGQLKSQ